MHLHIRLEYKSLAISSPNVGLVLLYRKGLHILPNEGATRLSQCRGSHTLPIKGLTLPIKGLTNYKHDCLTLSSKISPKEPQRASPNPLNKGV
jgi:hypothetical protein